MGAALVGSARRRLAINAVANWLGFAVQVVIAFVVSPLLVHSLGDGRYGIWSLVESVLAYFTLFDLGVASSVVRYVAKFEASEDQERLNRVYSTSLCIFVCAGLGILLVTLVLAFWGASPLGAPPEFALDTRWMLVLLGANIAFGLPLGIYPAIMDGLGRFPAKTVIRTCWLLIRTGIILAVVRAGGGLPGIALTTTVCSLGEHLVMALAVRHYMPDLHFSTDLVDLETFRMIRGYSVNSFVAMLAGRISFQTDALVIGAFLAPQSITFFAIAARLVEYGKSSLRSLTGVLTPAVSQLDARGDGAAIRRVLTEGTRYILYLILPIEAGLIILGKPFLALWMGAGYARLSYPTLVILSIPLALVISQSISGRILYGIGQVGWLARATIVEALINLGLSLALVRPLGIEGVAVGTAIPNIVLNLSLAYYICNRLGIRPFTYVCDAFSKPLAMSLLPTGIWAVAVRWAMPTDWISFTAVGAVGLGTYAIAVALLEIGPQTLFRTAVRVLGRLPWYGVPGGVSECEVRTTAADL